MILNREGAKDAKRRREEEDSCFCSPLSFVLFVPSWLMYFLVIEEV